MKQTYRVISGLIALGVLVQAGAIAAGWFTAIHDVDNGLVIDKNYDGNAFHGIHGFVGFNVMPLLGLILLVVSFFAAKSVPGARKWGGIVFGLIVLQVALALFAFSVPGTRRPARHQRARRLRAPPVRATMLTREAGAGPRQRGRRVRRPAAGLRLLGPRGVAPCQLTSSAAAGGCSCRRSSPSSRWARWAGTGSRAWCPRPTRSWTWGTSTTAAAPRTSTAPRRSASPT